MFRYCVLVLLVCIGIGCKPPAQDCRRFRTGTYTLKTDDLNYKFVRTETEQLETNLATGVWHRLQVTWLDDCSYTLKLLETSSGEPVTDQQMSVNITKTGENFYFFETNFDGHIGMTGRMIKTN